MKKLWRKSWRFTVNMRRSQWVFYNKILLASRTSKNLRKRVCIQRRILKVITKMFNRVDTASSLWKILKIDTIWWCIKGVLDHKCQSLPNLTGTYIIILWILLTSPSLRNRVREGSLRNQTLNNLLPQEILKLQSGYNLKEMVLKKKIEIKAIFKRASSLVASKYKLR